MIKGRAAALLTPNPKKRPYPYRPGGEEMIAKDETIASLQSQNQALTGKVTEMQAMLVQMQQQADPNHIPAVEI